MDELEKFVLLTARQRFYERKGTIKALKIIDLVKAVARHGLIREDSDALEKRLVKSLKGKLMGETKVSVNTYTIRHSSVDSRLFSGAPQLRMRTIHSLYRRAAYRRRMDSRMIAISEKTFANALASPIFASAVTQDQLSALRHCTSQRRSAFQRNSKRLTNRSASRSSPRDQRNLLFLTSTTPSSSRHTIGQVGENFSMGSSDKYTLSLKFLEIRRFIRNS